MRIRIAVFLFILVMCSKVFGCTCMGAYQAKTMREVAEWYAKRPDVALIFEGKVVKQEVKNGTVGPPATAMSMTGSGKYRVVEFSVTHAFLGRQQDTISVITGLGTGDCGYDFQTGQSYLVYASSGRGGVWFTSICSGTNEIDDAGTALRFLAGEKPVAEDLLSPRDYAKQYQEKISPKRTGSICGQVLKPDGTPLKGASVELWELRSADLPSRSADDPNTSTDGHFCIEHAEPGRYLLTAESEDFKHDMRYMAFYPGVSSRGEATTVEIRPGIRLPDVEFTTIHEPLYTIRIRVVTPNGSQLSEKDRSITVDSIYRDPLSYHIHGLLEEDGSRTFGYIPSGKYVVSTFLQPDFADSEMKSFPKPSTWNPVRQEVSLSGDTEVVIQMEPVKPD